MQAELSKALLQIEVLQASLVAVEAERDAARERVKHCETRMMRYAMKLAEMQAERDAARAEAEAALNASGENAKAWLNCVNDASATRTKLYAEIGLGEQRIKELEAKWKREECAHCDERIGGYQNTIWCAECFEWYLRESEKEYIQQLQSDLLAAQAGEARAVEALEAEQRAAHWRNLARITDKHEDHIEATRLSEIAQRLRHGIVLVLDRNISALDWLAQQRREAAAEVVNALADGCERAKRPILAQELRGHVAALLAGAEALDRLEAMESTGLTMLPKSTSVSEEACECALRVRLAMLSKSVSGSEEQ